VAPNRYSISPQFVKPLPENRQNRSSFGRNSLSAHPVVSRRLTDPRPDQSRFFLAPLTVHGLSELSDGPRLRTAHIIKQM
jgi:hypothetical protein